jgi:signal transduction histidine kinase
MRDVHMEWVTERLRAEAREMGSFGALVIARFGGPMGMVAAFAIAHTFLILLGYALKETISDPAVMWPSAGLAFVAFWLAPLRLWPAILLAQFIVEFAVGAVLLDPFRPTLAALYPMANAIEAMVGAAITRRLVGDTFYLRTRQILQILFATAAGAATGAMLGAWANATTFTTGLQPLEYLHQLQIWWAADWLGVLVVAPMLVGWLSPLRTRHSELALRSRIEVLALLVLVSAGSYFVFALPFGRPTSLLQMPLLIIGLLLYAAVRLPPRWMASLFMVAATICAGLAAMQRGPFLEHSLFVRTVEVQTFLGTLAVFTFLMSISMAEKNVALGQLGESEYRYRSFVELSMEAVWRVELSEPMPVSLPLEQQLSWLQRHARIVESSHSYLALDPSARPGGHSAWRSDLPWCAAYEAHLASDAGTNYSFDRLRFRVENGGRGHAFLGSFTGVVEEGCLRRIWGVARDVTELTDLNQRLLREQDRLKGYARQIVTAEEKARRATAVDLHDGIGQSLVGMAMTLDVASRHAPADVKLMVDEVRARLRDVQERTRHMISDLSPPGLYELGLVPALQWLVVYVRGHDRLHVELDARVREDAIRLESRVLVFKLVRELLRNVVKHAGVNAARVLVQGDRERLRVEVSDQGRGFEWQMDMFGGASGGFGLWSIADRIHEVGGTFRVDTLPGQGSRFELEFPLRQTLHAADSGRVWALPAGRSA